MPASRHWIDPCWVFLAVLEGDSRYVLHLGAQREEEGCPGGYVFIWQHLVEYGTSLRLDRAETLRNVPWATRPSIHIKCGGVVLHRYTCVVAHIWDPHPELRNWLATQDASDTRLSTAFALHAILLYCPLYLHSCTKRKEKKRKEKQKKKIYIQKKKKYIQSLYIWFHFIVFISISMHWP